MFRKCDFLNNAGNRANTGKQAALANLYQAGKPTTSTQTQLSYQLNGLPTNRVENLVAAVNKYPAGAFATGTLAGAGGIASPGIADCVPGWINNLILR